MRVSPKTPKPHFLCQIDNKTLILELISLKIIIINMSAPNMQENTDHKESRPSKTASILRRISIGKYDQGLYLDEKRQQSSICGGLFTVCLISIIGIYMAVIFYSVYKRSEFKVDEGSLMFDDSGIRDWRVSAFEGQLPRLYSIILNQNDGYTFCSDFTFKVEYEFMSQEIFNTSVQS